MWIAFQFSNTITLGSVILGIILSLIAIGGIGYAVVRGGRLDELHKTLAICQRTEQGWHEERDLAVAKADRLTAEVTRLTSELAEVKVAHAQEMAAHEAQQTELRHSLKAELRAAEMRTDVTTVLKGQQGILAALDRLDERSAKRDEAIIGTQLEIGQLLKQLTDRVTREVTEKVSEVVQEKVDQLQTDPSSAG